MLSQVYYTAKEYSTNDRKFGPEKQQFRVSVFNIVEHEIITISTFLKSQLLKLKFGC